MGVTAGHRLMGLVTAMAVAVIASAAQPVLAEAPSNGTLFGIATDFCCTTHLVQLDPSAGSQTVVASVPAAVSALVADPSSHLVYAAGFTGGGKGGFPGFPVMVTIDSQTGSVRTTQDIPGIIGMAFDSATHTILAVTFTFDPQTLTFSTHVDRLDPVTWFSTRIANLSNGTRELAFNPASGVLYTETFDFSTFPATGRLVKVNSRTGEVSTGPSLSPAVRALTFDTRDRRLYGVADGSPGQFVRLNSRTGAETPIGGFVFSAGFPTAAVIDSRSHTVYFVETEIGLGGQFISRIATVNDRTGAGTLGPTMPQTVTRLAFQRLPDNLDESEGQQDDG